MGMNIRLTAFGIKREEISSLHDAFMGGRRLLERGKNFLFTPRTNDPKAQASGAGPTDL